MESNFQTPEIVANYMASMVPLRIQSILEPTPGEGNLVKAVRGRGRIIAPENFWDLPPDSRFGCAIMNPPFTPMSEGYRYLTAVMEMTDNIVALLPWFILINSIKRLDNIMSYGLVSVTSLPRKTFPSCRIQCCILEMQKGFSGQTAFKKINW